MLDTRDGKDTAACGCKILILLLSQIPVLVSGLAGRSRSIYAGISSRFFVCGLGGEVFTKDIYPWYSAQPAAPHHYWLIFRSAALAQVRSITSSYHPSTYAGQGPIELLVCTGRY